MGSNGLSNWLRERSKSFRRLNRGQASGRKRLTTGTRERGQLTLEQLEFRCLLATITPVSFTAGGHEVNNLTLTADDDWLTYNEANPHQTFYLGAFNPDFLKSLQVTFTGNTNDHLTDMPIEGDIEGLVAGLEELEV